MAFRDGKASLHEGRVGVPAIMKWPDGLKPAVVHQPLHHVDLVPTLVGVSTKLIEGSPQNSISTVAFMH